MIIWCLWKTRHKKRILFLADRNILIDQTRINDFQPFGQAMTKITGRTVDPAYGYTFCCRTTQHRRQSRSIDDPLRPAQSTSGRIVSEQQVDEESVFIVNLDLKKFYNTIKRQSLLQRLQKISKQFGHKECPDFWQAFKRITDWKWSNEDVDLAKKHEMGVVKEGLPQGLVAAGFFANAYLIDFDRF